MQWSRGTSKTMLLALFSEFVNARYTDTTPFHQKMITASHLPCDRNGFKLFSALAPSGFTKTQVQAVGEIAECFALKCLEGTRLQCFSTLAPWAANVDWMPTYAASLTHAILRETNEYVQNQDKPLSGIKLVLNPGNGAGGFFQTVLDHLGADVSSSIHLKPNGNFPNGIPNPENVTMLQETLSVCEKEQADLGIMLDTDADRCGFVAPRCIDADTGIRRNYEALNRNRLIALLGVVFAKEKPGCAVVTDSVTSEGLSIFLEKNLGLQHVRYIKGYANVIGKARELTDSGKVNAELAIETSGHCAMRENGYLDDGTYTAVKIVSLLARQRSSNLSIGQPRTLLDLISNMMELDEVCELRMTTNDSSLDTMRDIFEVCMSEIERFCETNATWQLDKDNLEGIRLRFGSAGEFFMLRKSLHDPIISVQIEAQSRSNARELIVEPLIGILESCDRIRIALNVDVLRNY
jgi:phosphomannomutase